MGGRAWGDPGSDNGGITRMRLDRERGVMTTVQPMLQPFLCSVVRCRIRPGKREVTHAVQLGLRWHNHCITV